MLFQGEVKFHLPSGDKGLIVFSQFKVYFLNRRTSATLSAENGATALELQQKHNWKNPQMALEYISNTKVHREKMAEKIQGISLNKPTQQTLNQPSTSLEIIEDEPLAKKAKNEEEKNIVLSQSVESTSGPVFKFFFWLQCHYQCPKN